MAATALVKDALWQASVLLTDTAPQFQRFSERELVHLLNQAQVAVNKFIPSAAARVDAVKLVAGSRQSLASIAAADCKPGDGSTPSVPILGNSLIGPRRNMGADGLTPGKAIRMVDFDTMNMVSPGWHTETGTEVTDVVYDPQTPRYYYVYPACSGKWIELAYNAAPIPIPNTATVDSDGKHATGVYSQAQSSTQAITIDDEHLEDLVAYVVAVASLKDTKYADKTLYNTFGTKFVSSINAKVTTLTGTNPNLKMLPGIDAPAPRA